MSTEIMKPDQTPNLPAVQDPSRGVTTRQEFGATQTTSLAETASAAVAAQARATVEARYVMALKRPRDMDDVRVKLLGECRRPGFAAVARYRKPIGQGVEGPSIRFAEAAARLMGNISSDPQVVYDDREKRIVRVVVTDLESNTTHSKDVVLEKVVERSTLRQGQVPLRSRTNSVGRTVYLVEATEDDLGNKEAALVSKALRTCVLRLVPGDILEECMDQVVKTQHAQDAADPDAARKKLADAFASKGVKPSDLKEYLGHELGQTTPAEMSELRGMFEALRDGETTWKAILEAKYADDGNQKPNAATEALKSKLAAKINPQSAPVQATAPAPVQDPSPHSSIPSQEEQAEIAAREAQEALGVSHRDGGKGALFDPPYNHPSGTKGRRS